jgi:hypothetical protein
MVPMRPEIFNVIATPDAEKWCESDDFNWREVDENEFSQAKERKAEYTWVDDTDADS